MSSLLSPVSGRADPAGMTPKGSSVVGTQRDAARTDAGLERLRVALLEKVSTEAAALVAEGRERKKADQLVRLALVLAANRIEVGPLVDDET